MIGEHVDADAGPVEVVVGVETDRGPWVHALVASRYLVYPINPLQVARYRETERGSGGKSDAADAHTLADMMRTRRHTLRPMGGDSVQAETVKVLSRAHKTLIWERTRHLLRLRRVLRERPEVLALLGRRPIRCQVARLSTAELTVARSGPTDGASRPRPPRSRPACAADTRPAAGVASAYAPAVSAQVPILTTLDTEIAALEGHELDGRDEATFSPPGPMIQWIGASKWLPVCSPVRKLFQYQAGPRSSYALISSNSNLAVWPKWSGS